jgi:hypothetical protein
MEDPTDPDDLPGLILDRLERIKSILVEEKQTESVFESAGIVDDGGYDSSLAVYPFFSHLIVFCLARWTRR